MAPVVVSVVVVVVVNVIVVNVVDVICVNLLQFNLFANYATLHSALVTMKPLPDLLGQKRDRSASNRNWSNNPFFTDIPISLKFTFTKKLISLSLNN